MRLVTSTAFFDPYALHQATGMKNGDTVVDLHCGYHGVCTFPAAEQVGKEGRVYAVDVRRPAVDSIRGRSRTLGHGHVFPVWGNAQAQNGVPLDDEIADIVLLVGALSELQNRLEVVGEAKRLLKSGGRLVVVDWQATKGLHMGPAASLRASPSEARSICLVKGFFFDASVPIGTHHYAFVCSKK
ncbi:methyltransferase domain-containing protein [Candidatus Uhrbacteria bacterium]|nr:methyltransferase domain-containing protein [Candidatus Uhrbacteria bacterium]